MKWGQLQFCITLKNTRNHKQTIQNLTALYWPSTVSETLLPMQIGKTENHNAKREKTAKTAKII